MIPVRRQSIPRIGKVRMKSGATVIPMPGEQYRDWRGLLIERARTIAGYYDEGEMSGFFVVGFGYHGGFSAGYRCDPQGVIGPTLLPAFTSDVLRQMLIRSGQWTDPAA